MTVGLGRTRWRWVWGCILVVVLGCSESNGAEAPPVEPAAASTLQVQDADPADVASPEAIVKAVYDVISGPPGTQRNWDRWHTLFLAQATLHPVGRGPEGQWATGNMTPAQFVTNTDSVPHSYDFRAYHDTAFGTGDGTCTAATMATAPPKSRLPSGLLS